MAALPPQPRNGLKQYHQLLVDTVEGDASRDHTIRWTDTFITDCGVDLQNQEPLKLSVRDVAVQWAQSREIHLCLLDRVEGDKDAEQATYDEVPAQLRTRGYAVEVIECNEAYYTRWNQIVKYWEKVYRRKLAPEEAEATEWIERRTTGETRFHITDGFFMKEFTLKYLVTKLTHSKSMIQMFGENDTKGNELRDASFLWIPPGTKESEIYSPLAAGVKGVSRDYEFVTQ